MTRHRQSEAPRASNSAVGFGGVPAPQRTCPQQARPARLTRLAAEGECRDLAVDIDRHRRRARLGYAAPPSGTIGRELVVRGRSLATHFLSRYDATTTLRFRTTREISNLGEEPCSITAHICFTEFFAMLSTSSFVKNFDGNHENNLILPP